MAITPPVVDTEISASAFGVPVANFINGKHVAFSEITGTTGGIGSSPVDVAGLSVTFNALSTLRYKVTLQLEISSTVAGDVFLCNLVNASSTQMYRSTGTLVKAGAAQTVSLLYVEGAISGSTTRKVQVFRASGTGTLIAGGTGGSPPMAFILVEAYGVR